MLTTTSTGLLVRRNHGRSGARCSAGTRRPVERRALGQHGQGGVEGLDLGRRATCRAWPPCAGARPCPRRWPRSARASSVSTMARCSSGSVGPDHVVVGEGPQHEHDGVDLADAGEEAVAEALALARPLDQPADVDELDGGVHGLGAASTSPTSRSRRSSGTPGHADVGVDGGEGVGGGQGLAAREGVEERRLPGVGQADEAEAFHRGQVTGRGRRPDPHAILRRWTRSRRSSASPTCSTGPGSRPTGCGPTSRAAEAIRAPAGRGAGRAGAGPGR